MFFQFISWRWMFFSVHGLRDLVWLPIEQYRKDGRIIRGLQRGAASFGTSTASAALELSNRLVQAIQVLNPWRTRHKIFSRNVRSNTHKMLTPNNDKRFVWRPYVWLKCVSTLSGVCLWQATAETVYDILSPTPPLNRFAITEGRAPSSRPRRAAQPADLREGVAKAYDTVREVRHQSDLLKICILSAFMSCWTSCFTATCWVICIRNPVYIRLTGDQRTLMLLLSPDESSFLATGLCCQQCSRGLKGTGCPMYTHFMSSGCLRDQWTNFLH